MNKNLKNLRKEIEADNKTIYYEGKDARISLKVDIPKKLYKYYSLTNNALNNLISRKVHFSHPYTFNDIMDGSFMVWDYKNLYEDYCRESANKGSEQDFKNNFFIKFGESTEICWETNTVNSNIKGNALSYLKSTSIKLSKCVINGDA